MGKRLAKSVTLPNESGEYINYLKGTEPSEDIAEQITNPAAWEPESAADRADGGAWPPDGGFETMDDEEIFAAANSTSSSDERDLNTSKANGIFDSNSAYQSMTVPALRATAEERDLDSSGLTRKQELIDLLVEDDASNG